MIKASTKGSTYLFRGGEGARTALKIAFPPNRLRFLKDGLPRSLST